MFWRGGPTPTADVNVSSAPAPPSAAARRSTGPTACAPGPGSASSGREHGLEGVDGPEFDRHLDAVFERICANDRCSDLNGTQQRHEGGRRSARLVLRDDPAQHRPGCYTPETAGYIGFGDQSGAKRSADRTYLADAAERGAEFSYLLRRARADRGRPGRGRGGASGGPRDRPRRPVTVRAPRVVVACGALESPGAAAALGHRRSGGREPPAVPPMHRGLRNLR